MASTERTVHQIRVVERHPCFAALGGGGNTVVPGAESGDDAVVGVGDESRLPAPPLTAALPPLASGTGRMGLAGLLLKENKIARVRPQ